MTTEWDIHDQIATAWLNGEAKGRDNTKLEDARNFKRLGVSPDIIAKATGLERETVEAL